jgi:hypothetical protein
MKLVSEVVDETAALLRIQDDPRRLAVAKILYVVGRALYEIELEDAVDVAVIHGDVSVDTLLKQFFTFARFEEIRAASDAYRAQEKKGKQK